MRPGPLKIKVCGMKFSENIAEIAELKPDFMGLLFYRLSPRFVGEHFIAPNLKDIKKVGVFVDASQEEIKARSEKHSLDYLQLHGGQSAEFCRNLVSKGMKIIKVFNLDESFSFENIEDYAASSSYFLFDTKSKHYGGSGRKFPWEKLSEYHLNTPFFLSGGITPEDAEALLALSHPKLFGVDLNSGFENGPGLKNFTGLKHFIETIRS